MSYNTRRSNTGFGTPQSVGQRRPVQSNNFVPGGQLSGSQQKSQGQQQPRAQPQGQTGINFRNQNQQGQGGYNSNYSNNQQQQQQQQARYQQGQQTPVKQEPAQKPVAPQQQTPKPAPQAAAASTPVSNPASAIIPGMNPPAPDPEQDESMETNSDGTPKKRVWNKGKGYKISRAEKIRRRNLTLSKILQPKNAVMILNELVRGCVYNVEELPVKVEFNQFRGTVAFDGQEFAGTGRTKTAAKNSAAETALKHLVKNKQLHSVNKKDKEDKDGDEKMEITEDENSQVMPWSHIASFAMYKLFSTWGEDPSLVHKVGPQELVPSLLKPTAGQREPKPAKKMPENPETMNPLMLMHQMLPNAVWEELGKTGTAPSVVFSFEVDIDGKKFTGTGSSKKAAKKMAAFSACHEVLNISYPPDVWAPAF